MNSFSKVSTCWTISILPPPPAPVSSVNISPVPASCLWEALEWQYKIASEHSRVSEDARTHNHELTGS